MIPYPLDAPPMDFEKPFRVTAYRETSFGVVTRCFVVGDYRLYWQANIISFVYHHLFGFGCSTWKAPLAAITPPAGEDKA